MLIPIQVGSSSKLGHVGSETRSLSQIIEKKPCVHSWGHSSDPKFIKLCQNIISKLSLKLDCVGSKTMSQDQIIEKPCVQSRGHNFDPIFMKLCQNVEPHNI